MRKQALGLRYTQFQSLVRAYKRSDIAPSEQMPLQQHCFNPSFGLTSVPTVGDQGHRVVRVRFNPSFGLTSVPTKGELEVPSHHPRFQSLVRAYKRSDANSTPLTGAKSRCFNPSFGLTSVPTFPGWSSIHGWNVSIPRSGLQAFRRHP